MVPTSIDAPARVNLGVLIDLDCLEYAALQRRGHCPALKPRHVYCQNLDFPDCDSPSN